MGGAVRARVGTRIGMGSAALVAVGVWSMAAVPSAGSGTCVRSVDVNDHESAALAESALVAALADADDGVAMDGCTSWRIDLAGTFLLTSDLEWMTSVPLHLVGPVGGTARLEVQGSPPPVGATHRVLTVDTFPDEVEVKLERLVLVGGDVSRADGDSEGGAVLADVLRLIDVELRGNEAVSGGAVSTIDLHAVRTSFVGNGAEFRVAQGGAVFARGDVTLENVTFDGNVAGAGGALWMDTAVRGTGSLQATFVTFVRNRANTSGADLHLAAGADALSVTLRGTVFGGVAGTVVACGGSFPFALASRTAVFGTDTSCGLAAGDVMSAPTFGTVPFLTGTTALPAPPGTAPFIDAVACGAGWPAVDQRGVTRPQGSAGRCDAGSVELEPLVEQQDEAEDGSSFVTDQPPVPTRIPAGGGGCAAGCPLLTSDADAPARRR